MFCPKCGAKMPDGTKFCSLCGAELPSTQSAPVKERATLYCAQCGEKIFADLAVCPNCGAEQKKAPEQAADNSGSSPERAKAQNPRSRKFIIGICAAAAVVVALIVVGILALTGVFSSNSKKFLKYQSEFISDRFLSGIEDLINIYGSGKFSSDITLTADISGGSADKYGYSDYLKNSSAVFKVDIDGSDILINGALTVMGTQLIDGTFTYDDGVFGFYLPQIDNSYYTINLSEFLYNNFGINVDLSEMGLPEISASEAISLVKAYMDVVNTIVNDKSVTANKNASFALQELNGSYNGTVYTFTPRAEDIEKMLNSLADKLENDKNLKNLIKDVLGSAYTISTAAYSSSDDIDNALNYILSSAADEIRDNAKDIAKEFEEYNFTWTLCMEGKEIRMIRIGTEDEYIAYECRDSGSGGIEEIFYLSSYGYVTSIENDYTQTGDNYAGTFTLAHRASSSSGQAEFEMYYDIDKSERSVLGYHYGTYEFNTGYIYASLEVKDGGGGSCDHIFKISDPYGYTFDDIFEELEITLNTTEKSSAAKPNWKAVDITYYTEDDLEDLFADFVDEIEDDFYSMIFGMYVW